MTESQATRIPLSEPLIAGNEWKYVKECLDTGWVSSVGSFVDRFEREVAAYLGVKYAVAVVNGTAALHLALIAAGVQSEEEVLVPTLTFIAPVNAVRYVGAYPVFFDCDPATLGMDVSAVVQFFKEECEQRISGLTYNKKTGRRIAAIIPVHVFGHPVEMDPLCELGKKYNVGIIEDATESFGSQYKGRKAGALGDIGCLSFNGNKIITTGGGGMLVTNNEEWARRARHLSTQAKKNSLTYDHDEIGYNYRLTNVLAAIGVAQLERLEEFVSIKRHINDWYRESLRGVKEVHVLKEQTEVRSNYWLTTIQVAAKDRDPLIQYLATRNIEVRPPWKLIHTLSIYGQSEKYEIHHAPEVYEQCLNLPSSVSLGEANCRHIVDAIKKYYKPLPE